MTKHVVGYLVDLLLFTDLPFSLCQSAARGLLRQQREAAALSAGDHRMANSQGRRAVRAAAHRRRRGGRAAPERVPSGNAPNNTAPLSGIINMHAVELQGRIHECVHLDMDEFLKLTAGEHR